MKSSGVASFGRPAGAMLLVAMFLGCGRTSDAKVAADARAALACPARAKAASPLSGVPAELERADYWLPERDDLLLDVPALAVQDDALRRGIEAPRGITDLQTTPEAAAVQAAFDERLSGYRAQLAAGEYARGQDLMGALAAASELAFSPSLHVALSPVSLRCVPLAAPLTSTRGDDGFDRNRCSQARAQEPIEVLGRVGTGFRLARTRNAFGFIADDADLSPPVPAELVSTYRTGPTVSATRALSLNGQQLPPTALLHGTGDGAVWLASRSGIARTRALGADEAQPIKRPLTRRSFLQEAFRYVGMPYGWGDENGGRDCSRFVLDVLASFGLTLPRTSAHQRSSGRYTVEVPDATSETERLALLDAAVERGVVLVHFPGHIMFYLGRDRTGVPRALHSFAEYVAPCPGGGETVTEVQRVGVSDLSLGKGTSRRSFLERITHVTVFGRAPGYELLALARFRPPVPLAMGPAKACKNSPDVALFTSPRAPDAGRPLRAIAVSGQDVRPASLWLVGPDGVVHAPPQHDLGVGPYARWTELATPAKGRYRVLLADGEDVLACTDVTVADANTPTLSKRTVAAAPAWNATAAWDAATERLYAAFVEQLFSHDVEDLRSWPSLSALLQDPARNLLFDHRGLGEDTHLSLSPDCADLPYLLRAYFAFKLSLPFGFHRCTRGKTGEPPRCGELVTQAEPVAAPRDLDGFDAFWRTLRDGVHSASGRTQPTDPVSDLYPLPLERSALAPGSVFIDPYGHMIVVAKWVPQGLSGRGMLLGADAQPDATVGRRRFWRGNFLFTPKTDEVGAGFKAFRPVAFARGVAPTPLDDAQIAESRRFPPPSLAQYAGDLDAFYQRMDELIYPRPVALADRMARVVDALDEQVKRRVEAIDVGEAGLKGRHEPVPMPEGYAIFETSGPWEDFATPSRDMRLLIAIDAVRAFPGAVRAAPKRYGIDPGDASLAGVDAQLAKLLGDRRFTYTRSDGSTFTLTLSDVLARLSALEVAYNPNDCPELRWGAPEGSDELAPCTRRAPGEQRALLERYRPWFHDRARPARP